MIDVKSEITYLLVVDYLTRMAADQVISEKELAEASGWRHWNTGLI